MDALDRAMDEAFWRVWPRLVGEGGGAALGRRVGRRQGREMLAERVDRAMCLRVGAGDLRNETWRAARVPEDAFDRATGPGRRVRLPMSPCEHKVVVGDSWWGEVCGPVRIGWPGVTLAEAGADEGDADGLESVGFGG